MTKNQKTILLIAGAFLAAKLLKNLLKTNPEKQENKAQSKELNELNQQGIKPTYPDSQYFLFADALEDAMFDIGTDETQIYYIFKKLKNDADFLKLEQAFGSRAYSGGYVPSVFYGNMTLAEWISQELDSGEKAMLNAILMTNGIKYRY